MYGDALRGFEDDDATLVTKRDNLTERLQIGNKFRNGRARGPPKSMLPERWRKNRDALRKLIGSYIGKHAGDSLVELVQEEYAKAEKPGYDLLKADEVFCEVIRKWVAAGVKLLKDADVGVYIDTVDTGQLVTAHLTSKPEDRVKTPCAENYPTVLGDRSTDDEVSWEAHKRRQIEKERILRQAEAAKLYFSNLSPLSKLWPSRSQYIAWGGRTAPHLRRGIPRPPRGMAGEHPSEATSPTAPS